MNNIEKFIELIEEQANYGGVKYTSKTDSKREATDDLFDDFGKNWLYGTMAKYCYSEDTEILTDKGWKFFKDLDKTESVATLNPISYHIEYQKPIDYQIFSYNGNLNNIKNKYIDLLVTDKHSLFVKENKNGVYNLKQLKEVNKKFYTFLSGNWFKKDKNLYFDIPILDKKHKQTRIKEYKFLLSDWCKFLGWFLSEGYTSYYEKEGHYKVDICQSKSKYRKEIKELLNKMNISYSVSKDRFHINDKTLWSYLKQFGKSNEKYIPENIKNCSYANLNNLFDSLIKGDGHTRKIGNNIYYSYFTVSEKLSNDVSELAFKLGYHCTVARQKTKNFIGYRLNIRKHNETFIKNNHKSKIQLNKEVKVYDVTVPKYHTLYVRRNGKPCWSGNCKRYENLIESIPAKSERDLLKIGTYCYILWLKRGFFVSEQGIDSPVVTLNVALKQKYFGDFISVVSTPEPLKKILSALGIYSDEVPNYRLLYLKLKEYANKDWKQLSEFDIKLAFHLVYQEWNNRFGHLEVHDTDTGKK